MIRTQTTSYKVFAITPGADPLPRPPSHGILVLTNGNVTLEVDGAAGPVSVSFVGLVAGTRIELVPLRVTAATAGVVGLF